MLLDERSSGTEQETFPTLKITAPTPGHASIKKTTIPEQWHQCTPELRLLLHAASEQLGHPVASALPLAPSPLNWQHVLYLAKRHRLTAILHGYLTSHPEMQPPELLTKALNSYCLAQTRQHLLKAGELRQIITATQSNGITIIPYKGPVFGETAYGSLALREFSDLDLLVQPKDLPAVTDILSKQGYQVNSELPSDWQQVVTSPNTKDITLSGADRSIYLELHWQLARTYQGFDLPIRQLFERAISSEWMDIYLPLLSPEDTLLVHSFNAAKDRWNRISLIVDIAMLLKSCPELDWDYLMQTAEHYHLDRRLKLALWLPMALFGIKLPEHLISNINTDTAIQKLGNEVLRWHASEKEISFWGIRKNLFTMRMHEHPPYRRRVARRFIREIFTPGAIDRATLLLPGYLQLLYIPLRLARIGKKYIKNLFK
ncbi:MAG: nucleotidyltransferase family protein [Calditrichia bacterium]